MATALTEFYPGIRVHIPEVTTPLLDYYLREAAREFCKETLIYQAWCDYNALAVNVREYTLAPPSGYLVVRAIRAKIKHTASNGIITAATAADPIVLTSVDHGLVTGARVYIEDMDEMTELNDLTHTVYEVTDDTFSIDIDGSGYTPETTGGLWNSVSAYTDLPPKTEGFMDTENPDWRISGVGLSNHFYAPDTETVALSFDPTAAVPNGLRVLAALQPIPAATTVPDVLFNDHHSAVEAGVISMLLRMPRKDWTDLKTAAVYLATFSRAKRAALGDRMASNTHRASAVLGGIGAYT